MCVCGGEGGGEGGGTCSMSYLILYSGGARGEESTNSMASERISADWGVHDTCGVGCAGTPGSLNGRVKNGLQSFYVAERRATDQDLTKWYNILAQDASRRFVRCACHSPTVSMLRLLQDTSTSQTS